jgi:NAD-dependent dihydropyrimidine dehydrogenase PreA subunit
VKINKEKCIGCEVCHPYCTVGAIITIEWCSKSVSEIIEDECVECGVCLRSEVCPTQAIYMPELKWPRSIRAAFSDPLSTHPSTNEMGRGTEEMKTNDVTGRFGRGIAGVAVEMGRPGVGTTFEDLQKVCMTLARVGVQFEPENPVSAIMVDKKTGEINAEILDEKVLSAIIEFKIENDRLMEALLALKEISNQIDTVFSVGLITRVTQDESIPSISIAREAGFLPRPNTKTNIGLGRPLKEEI